MTQSESSTNCGNHSEDEPTLSLWSSVLLQDEKQMIAVMLKYAAVKLKHEYFYRHLVELCWPHVPPPAAALAVATVA